MQVLCHSFSSVQQIFRCLAQFLGFLLLNVTWVITISNSLLVSTAGRWPSKRSPLPLSCSCVMPANFVISSRFLFRCRPSLHFPCLGTRSVTLSSAVCHTRCMVCPAPFLLVNANRNFNDTHLFSNPCRSLILTLKYLVQSLVEPSVTSSQTSLSIY